VEAALIRDKFDVVPSEDHDQMHEDASDSEETPCTSSDTDGEGVGATEIIYVYTIYGKKYSSGTLASSDVRFVRLFIRVP